LRRVREAWPTLLRVPGARRKRMFLNLLGRREARQQSGVGFPGNDWLAGITDPPWVADPEFLARWLSRVPGEVVELTCHPGYLDTTLVGRDCTLHDGQLQRRVREQGLLWHASFQEACRRARFTLVSPSEASRLRNDPHKHAA
jgi:chitin disaccharide deacetylase